MNLKGRIGRLETRRAREDDTITLADIVAASYLTDSGPRDPELEERFSRSRLAQLIAECFDRGCRAEVFALGSAGETGQGRLH